MEIYVLIAKYFDYKIYLTICTGFNILKGRISKLSVVNYKIQTLEDIHIFIKY